MSPKRQNGQSKAKEAKALYLPTELGTAEHLSAVQASYLLTTLADPHFRLLQPIELEVEQGERGEFIVSNRQLGNYGAGSTLQAAIDDYQSMLIDLYQELTDSEAILSRHLHQRLGYLRTVLAPR